MDTTCSPHHNVCSRVGGCVVYLANTYESTGKIVISCGLVAIWASSNSPNQDRFGYQSINLLAKHLYCCKWKNSKFVV